MASPPFPHRALLDLPAPGQDLLSPALCLPGDFTKNRKDARQPITRELADELAVLAAGKPPGAGLLDIPSSKAWRMFKADCRRARIAPETAEGKASWHSLRKSFVNALVRSGADLKTIMELARHSSASLSMEVYATVDPRRLREAAEAAAAHVKAAVSVVSMQTGCKRVMAAGGGADIPPDESGGLELAEMVGAIGFEPTASASRTQRSSQTELRPDPISDRSQIF